MKFQTTQLLVLLFLTLPLFFQEEDRYSFSTLNFGVIFNLGNKKHHADWY